MGKITRTLGDLTAGVYLLTIFGGAALKDSIKSRLSNETNDVAPEIEDTARIRLSGLKYETPKPTPDDLKWSKKLRRPYAVEIRDELEKAITEHRNWRVWYLINRPYEMKYYGSPVHYGFSGQNIGEGLYHACLSKNFVAAYYMLKLAEKEPAVHRYPADQREDARDAEVRYWGLPAITTAMHMQADDIVTMLASSVGTLDALRDYRGNPLPERATRTPFESYEMAAIKEALTHGRTDYIDTLLAKGMRHQDIIDGYNHSFGPDDDRGFRVVFSKSQRASLLDWMLSNNIVDKGFAAEAAQKEKAEDQRIAALESGKARGWHLKLSPERYRRFGKKSETREEGSMRVVMVPDSRNNMVEITLPADGAGKRISHLFNYETGMVATFNDDTDNAVSLVPIKSFPDRKMANEGRTFLIANDLKPQAIA